jgi:O-antigen/teichoic acid export membrane protein
LRIGSNAAWLIGCRISANLLNLVLFVAISRYFGPAGIGSYSYGFAIAGFVYVFGSLGIDEYGIREYTRSSIAQRPVLLGRLLGTQFLMLALTTAGLAVYLLLTHASAATIGIVTALGVYQLGYAIARTLFIPALADQAMMGPALIELICRGGAFVVAAAMLVLAGWPLVAAISLFAAFGVLMAVLALNLARRHCRHVRVSISRSGLGSTVRILWSFAAAEVMGQVYGRIGLIVLTLQVSTQAAGLYATGGKFIETACMPFSYLGIAAYPRLSHLSISDNDGFVRLARNLWHVWIVLGGLALWGLFFVVPPLLVPLLGADFAAVGAVIELMMVLALMQVLEVILSRIMLATDLQVARVRIITGAALLSLLLNFVLVSDLKLPGAILATTLTMTVMNLFYAVAIHRRVAGLHLGSEFALLLTILLPGALIAWAVMALLHQPRHVAAIVSLLTLAIASLPLALRYWRRDPRLMPTAASQRGD